MQFGNGKLISFQIWLGMWLLFLSMLELELIYASKVADSSISTDS